MKTVTTEQLKQLVDLANSVPQEYKIKCFELLLSHTLNTMVIPDAGAPPKQITPVQSASHSTKKPFVLPIDVKAFLSQYSLDESIIWKLFLVEGSEVRPIYQLKETKKAVVQIQYALLLSLENALSTGQYQVDIEVLRQRCIDQKSYDTINFMTILKKNQNLFKNIDKDQPLILSPEGKSELADVIESLNS